MARLASPDHHCRSLPLSPSADIFEYCLLCDEMQICGAIEVKSTIIIIIIVNKEMKNIYILHWNRWIRLSKDFCFLNFQFFDPLPHHRSIDRSLTLFAECHNLHFYEIQFIIIILLYLIYLCFVLVELKLTPRSELSKPASPIEREGGNDFTSPLNVDLWRSSIDQP